MYTISVYTGLNKGERNGFTMYYTTHCNNNMAFNNGWNSSVLNICYYTSIERKKLNNGRVL